jgi:hypothetical protein
MSKILVTGLILILSSGIWAQTPIVVSKLTEAINFDGMPDEDVWLNVPALEMTMYSPVYGNKQTEKATIKIAYDDEYFYLSGVLRYKSHDLIRAIGKKRDYAEPSSDWLGLIVDTFSDKQNAVAFWTNPNGLRSDATVMNDLAYDNADINFSWNTFWDVKTEIGDKEWYAELRIPFSSLRFQNVKGKTTMGIIICQFSAGSSEIFTFPPVEPIVNGAYWKPSLTTSIEFTGLNPTKPVYVTPYATAGIGLMNELNEAATDYELKSTPKYDAGVDIKYSITNNLTADITINTDFAQVEADDQKINLSKYSLYFPEKRSFFQEKSDIFNFSFTGDNNLFYSRRIGLYNDSPVRIYGGMRMTGRINKWDLGILDMQTAETDGNPGENFGVLRTKRTVLNPNSYAGAMVTSRIGMDGTYNLAYGLDGQFRLIGDDYLTVKWAQTFENDSPNRFFDLSPSRLLVNWEHRNQKGVGYDFVYTWSGKQFNPGIGFEELENYHGVKGVVQYGWFPAEKKPVLYQRVYVTAANIWNTVTMSQETFKGSLSWYVEAKKGYYGSSGIYWTQDDITDTLYIAAGQAYIPPGRFRFANMSVLYGTSSSHALSAYSMISAGKYYDGWNYSFSIFPTLNIGTSLSTSLTYYLDYVNFPSRSMKFTNHIVGVKGTMTLTTKTSLSAFIQYNTAVNKALTNVRFRYNPREGNDFYLVYDEGLNTRLTREIPNLPFSSGRTILAKYTYTFRF